MDRETLDEIKRHFGIVVEDVRSDVRGVAESVDALRGEMHRETAAVRSELGQEIGSVGAALASTREDLGSQIGAVRKELASTREELGSEIGAVRRELTSTREELGFETAAVREDLGGRIQAVADEGRVRHDEFREFRGNVAEEFEETRALVRLSYGQLDRRVRTLETEMADVRVRLERVEGHIPG